MEACMHLGEFKKIGEDKHEIHMQHPQGHRLSIKKSMGLKADQPENHFAKFPNMAQGGQFVISKMEVTQDGSLLLFRLKWKTPQ